MTIVSATAWMPSTTSSSWIVRSWMSSRSNGVMKASSSRRLSSRSISSPRFSSFWISAMRLSRSSKCSSMSRSATAAAWRFSPSATNRSKNLTSFGSRRNDIERLLSSAEADRVEDEPCTSGDDRRRGDRDDPGEEDAPGDSPPDALGASRGPDTHDGARDDVGGRDRHAEMRGAKDDAGGGRLGGESVDGLELDDAVTHRMHDPPATDRGPA